MAIFEAFGVDRSCLILDASQLPSSYSHVHFAFGQISSVYDVDLSGSHAQFEIFANQTYFKRVLSFGGGPFRLARILIRFSATVTDANRHVWSKRS